MSYYKYKNNHIYYEEIGEGIPLIFLHGNTASSNMFLGVIDKYKTDFKVVLIDFLGHGKSDRLKEFPVDFWFDEAQQIITFLKEKGYENSCIIGTSGGALTAINVALEAPEFISKIIVDSFEGEIPLKEFTSTVAMDREASKYNENTKQFYFYMHGDDWENVVDNDTSVIIQHEKQIGKFFHKDLSQLIPDILMTGSKQDEFFIDISPIYFENVYSKMLDKIGHGKMYLFDRGGHPAMLSNSEAFTLLARKFLLNKN